MKGSRKRGTTASSSLNEMSSDEDTGSSSSDYEADADTNNEVTNDFNHVSSSSQNDIVNSDSITNSAHPESSPSITAEPDIRNVPSVSSPESPQPGSSEISNRDERDLSQEEVDKLVQLQDLTGLLDIQLCKELLESKNWNIDAILYEQFNLQCSIDQNTIRESSVILHNNNLSISENRAINESNQTFTMNIVNLITNVLRWSASWIFVPFRIVYITICSTTFLILRVFHFVTRRDNLFSRMTRIRLRGDVLRFQQNLEQQYGLMHPPIFEGTYSQALEKAKKDLQFLLVYLHCPSHQDTNEFCERVICSPELTNFTSEQNVIFWACSVDSGEGYRVSEALHESTYPFLAVIVLRQNRMMIVGRLEGAPPDPQIVTERLNSVVRDNEAFIVAARADRAERHMTQTIRQEQDEALQDALRQDQEKERKKKEEEEEIKRVEEEEKKRLEAEQDRKEKIARAKIDCASLIPEEPDKSASDAIRIVIKLPEGQRLERKFLKTESMKYLYYYVFCHPESPDDFDITTNFPRKVLKCKPPHLTRDLGLCEMENPMPDDLEEPPTFEAAGIGQSTMLFVNDLEA